MNVNVLPSFLYNPLYHVVRLIRQEQILSKRDHLQEHGETSGGESTNARTNLGTVVGLDGAGSACWAGWGLAGGST
jgi:hypothetical protein